MSSAINSQECRRGDWCGLSRRDSSAAIPWWKRRATSGASRCSCSTASRDSGPLLQPTNVMCRGRKRRSMLSAADAIPRTPKSMTPPAVNPKEDDMQRLPKIERDDISGDLAHFYDAVTRLPGHWRWTAALNGRSSIASHGACDMVR